MQRLSVFSPLIVQKSLAASSPARITNLDINMKMYDSTFSVLPAPKFFCFYRIIGNFEISKEESSFIGIVIKHYTITSLTSSFGTTKHLNK